MDPLRSPVLALFCVVAALPAAPQGTEPVKTDVHAHPNPAPAPAQGGGNAWFSQVNIDLGTFIGDEHAVGSFKFKNPTESEQRFSNILGSCACTRAVLKIGERKYSLDKEPTPNTLHRWVMKDDAEVKEPVSHVTVGPHEEGEIEVHMEMHGVRGPKEATLDIQTSDTSTPHVKLTWRAVGAVFFEVNPPDINFNEMTWNDKRDFQFEISSPLKEDFNIVGHEPLTTGVSLAPLEKTTRNGRAVWVVKGSYGPGVDERHNGATLTFRTDLQGKTVEARVIAFVKGPLTVEPGGFLSLGHVPVGTAKHVAIKIVPSDDFDLRATKVEFEDLMVPSGHADKVFATNRMDGKTLVIELRVAEGLPRCNLRGKLKVHLNHPAAAMKEFLFNGFVR